MKNPEHSWEGSDIAEKASFNKHLLKAKNTQAQSTERCIERKTKQLQCRENQEAEDHSFKRLGEG